MKNNKLNIDKYFEIAKSAPLVISKDEVLSIIGNMPCAPQISFKHTVLKFKNIIIMTTSVITTIITAIIFLANPSEKIKNTNEPVVNENKVIVVDSVKEYSESEVININNEKDINFNEALTELNEENDTVKVKELIDEPEADKDSLKSKETIPGTNFIVQKVNKPETIGNNPIIKEVFSKSILDDTINNKKNVETKYYNNEYDYKPGSIINVSNRYGVVNVKTWNKNKVNVKAVVTVKSPDKNSIEEFFNNFDITPEKQNGDLYIKQPVVSQSNIGILLFVQVRRTKFKNGKKIKRIHKFSVDYEITVPEKCNLELKNRYNDIYVEDIDGKLSIDLYDADLRAGNIKGFFDFKLKYGKADIKSINNSSIDIYESDLGIGTANVMKLKSKYSELKFEQINAIELDSYEDEIVIASDMLKFKGKLLYGEVDFKNVNKCDLNLYETDITGGKFSNFKYEGKYSKIEIQGTDSMDIFNSYEDKFIIAEAGVIFGKGKYAEFDIRKLSKSMNFNNYEGFVDIYSTGNNLEELKFKSKYTNYDIILNSNASYNFDVNCKYGNFDFPKENFEETVYAIDDDDIKIQGTLKGKSETEQAKVSFDCYEAKVNITLR